MWRSKYNASEIAYINLLCEIVNKKIREIFPRIQNEGSSAFLTKFDDWNIIIFKNTENCIKHQE